MTSADTDIMIRLLDQLVDANFKIANELFRIAEIMDGKRDPLAVSDGAEVPMSEKDKVESIEKWYGIGWRAAAPEQLGG